MTTEGRILELLKARKVFDGRVWHVFNASGVEISDAGGVLWRGVHGALLWGSSNEASVPTRGFMSNMGTFMGRM